MGYNTDLIGSFDLDKPLTVEQLNTLRDFADQAHSTEGTCPGGFCQWVPSDDGKSIEWDGNEKFYDYVSWLRHLIVAFIAPWGLKLNGEVEWRGDEDDDMGMIVVKDNVVTTKRAKITYE